MPSWWFVYLLHLPLQQGPLQAGRRGRALLRARLRRARAHGEAALARLEVGHDAPMDAQLGAARGVHERLSFVLARARAKPVPDYMGARWLWCIKVDP